MKYYLEYENGKLIAIHSVKPEGKVTIEINASQVDLFRKQLGK